MSESVTLHLMRHGEPTMAGRLLGRTDCPATPHGIARCGEAARRLEVSTVIASDLRRAAECGAAAAEGLGLPLRLDPRWRELDFGAWDGLDPAEVESAALARFWRDPDTCPPPDGERWSSLVARVAAAVTEVTAPTLVVTHAGAMRAALAALCGLDAQQVWAFDLPYGCVLSLAVWPGPPRTAQVRSLVP